jgi:hypothetical protein
MVAVCCENYMKPVSTVCVQSAELCNITTYDTSTYRWALMGKKFGIFITLWNCIIESLKVFIF